MALGKSFLIFGGTGAIGSAVASGAVARGWSVTATRRSQASPASETDQLIRWIDVDPFAATYPAMLIASGGTYDAVCWAQGANVNDTIRDFEAKSHENLYNANVMFILLTLQTLLVNQLLSANARLCVISSIWQDIARQSKLSYSITKAALRGLVLSASADLAAEGHLINAVLPGVLDTPMTRKNLSTKQIETVQKATGFDRLPSLETVASLVLFLCSDENKGLTGQFVSADLGFTNVRFI